MGVLANMCSLYISFYHTDGCLGCQVGGYDIVVGMIHFTPILTFPHQGGGNEINGKLCRSPNDS